MIRFMTMDDVPKVAELERMIFTDPWSENVYRETLKIDGVIYLVIIENNEIIGVAGVRNILGDGEITNVMITPEYRGKGYSRVLLESLMDEGCKIGITDFTLEVRAGNEVAINLYKSLGFESSGIRPGFYEHPKEDAMIMWKRSAL